MSLFDKWFQYQCKKAWNAVHNDVPVPCKAVEDVLDHRKSYNIKMQSANGGTILEVSHYDNRKDEYNRDLYIIEQDKDIGQEISKILVQYQLTHT